MDARNPRVFDTLSAVREPAARGVRPPVVTFAEAMAAVINLHRPNWKPTSNTEQQWRSLLAQHIDPTIGPMPVADVAATDVVAVLDRVWDRPELARRAARRISTTMKWAMGRGLRETDPTSAAVAAVPKLRHRPNHHRALHHGEVADALKRIRASEAAAATKQALELLALTATRPGEVRHATWDVFDLDTAVWTIPAARYKTDIEFRVPLSARAVELLTEARDTNNAELVFPSPVTTRAVSENTYVKLLRDLDIPSSAHGLRATFCSWCSDTGVPRDLAEMALGHAVRGIEGAYARSDMLERRRALMQRWDDYIAQANAPGS